MNTLQAVDQRRTMRQEAIERVVKGAYLAKVSKGKRKIPYCDHCKKIRTQKKECSNKGKP